MRFAVRIEDAGFRIRSHAAGAVLVADAFKGYALLEVSMERNGCAGVASLLENVDPAIFEALEGFDIIRRVRELDSSRTRRLSRARTRWCGQCLLTDGLQQDLVDTLRPRVEWRYGG